MPDVPAERNNGSGHPGRTLLISMCRPAPAVGCPWDGFVLRMAIVSRVLFK